MISTDFDLVFRRSRAIASLIFVILWAFAGCRPAGQDAATDDAHDASANRPLPAATQTVAVEPVVERSASKPTPDISLPQRGAPSGRPARSALCGHAVAFAGWHPDDAGIRDVLLVSDPGDNTVAEVGHVWTSDPSELPVHFGSQRPAIVLQHGGLFTVTGAVIVAPSDFITTSVPIRMLETVATELPDLSQELSPQWPGLCGPTSAADVLFSIRAPGQSHISDLVRGPGREADEFVGRLITGGLEHITEDSLAGRMGSRETSIGVTNDGIRRGLQSWLDEREPGAWGVRLLWFDDAEVERSREEQREFFGQLAAAVEVGGGAILCLWPGVEFSSTRTDSKESSGNDVPSAVQNELPAGGTSGPAASRAGRSSPTSAASDRGDTGTAGVLPLPDAAFPLVPPSAAESVDAPGRPEAIDFEQVAVNASAHLATARQRLANGNANRGYEAAVEAVSLLHPAARRDASLKPLLAEALELCRECDLERESRPLNTDKPIEYR